MYLIKLLFAYLPSENIATQAVTFCYFSLYGFHEGQIVAHVVLLKSFWRVGYSGIFLMSSQSLSGEHKRVMGSQNKDYLKFTPSVITHEKICWKFNPYMLLATPR